MDEISERHISIRCTRYQQSLTCFRLCLTDGISLCRVKGNQTALLSAVTIAPNSRTYTRKTTRGARYWLRRDCLGPLEPDLVRTSVGKWRPCRDRTIYAVYTAAPFGAAFLRRHIGYDSSVSDLLTRGATKRGVVTAPLSHFLWLAIFDIYQGGSFR